MIFEEAVGHLRSGHTIRYGSFEFSRRSFAINELAVKGSLGDARYLLNEFFSDGWEVETKPGVWVKSWK